MLRSAANRRRTLLQDIAAVSGFDLPRRGYRQSRRLRQTCKREGRGVAARADYLVKLLKGNTPYYGRPRQNLERARYAGCGVLQPVILKALEAAASRCHGGASSSRTVIVELVKRDEALAVVSRRETFGTMKTGR